METAFDIVAGVSMSGKTYKLCRDTLKEAYDHPEKNYIIVVPDQAGNAYEKKLIEMNKELYGRPGFMNIDILGFSRLAFRIFEAMGVRDTSVLEEYEKSMLIRVVSGERSGNLSVYGSSIDKSGFISEMKSLISEFIQYNISVGDLEKVIDEMRKSGKTSLAAKLEDVSVIYDGFLEVLGQMDSGISEDRMKTLAKLLISDKPCNITDGTSFIFDEFRGYTPDQLNVIGALSRRAGSVKFGICIDPDILKKGLVVREHDIFRQSNETIRSLQECIGFKPRMIYMEGNTSRHPELVHLSRNVFRYPISEYYSDDKSESPLEIYTAADPASEIRLAAEEIRNLIKRGMRYKDITIVTGDMEGFDRYADTILSKYGIPVFMDYSRKLRKNPFTQALLKSVEIVTSDFSYDSVFGFMKTGVTGIGDIDIIDSFENHVLRTGMRGKKMWSRKLRPYKGRNSDRVISAQEEAEFLAMDKVREQIVESVDPLIGFSSGKAKVKEYILALRVIMRMLGFENKLQEASEFTRKSGLLTESRIMLSLYQVLDRLLTETEELLGNVEMSLTEFIEIFQSGIDEISVGVIPPTIDSVHVCDPERSRIIDARALIMIGVNDGVIPRKKSSGRILSDKDKQTLSDVLESMEGKKLAGLGVQQSIDDLFLIYQILSKPVERLIISYTNSDSGGNRTEPSFVVGRISRMFPDKIVECRKPSVLSGTPESDKPDMIQDVRFMLEELHASDGEQRSRGYNERLERVVRYLDYTGERTLPDAEDILPGLDFSNRAQDIPFEIINNINLKISVSKIESYAGCPYEYFLKYILGLQERPERKMEYYDVGNILHGALEMVFETIKETKNNSWEELDDDTLVEMMHSSLNKAWEEYDINAGQEEDGKTMEVRRRLESLSGRTIKTLKKHIIMGEFRPEGFEQGFSAQFTVNCPDGSNRDILLRGKIDRLDMKEEDDRVFIRVIDYKTGNHDFKAEEIREGTDIQLSLYTRIITEILQNKYKDKKVIPAGMYFYHIDDPVIKPVTAKLLAECDGNEAKAGRIQIEKTLKLRGVSDMSPHISSETKSESGDYPHRFLNLHDISLVSPETGTVIGNSDIVPVSGKDGEISDSSVVVDSENMDSIGGFSLEKMKQETEKIISGCFEKSPIRFSSAQKGKCSFCDFRAVCRFNPAAGNERWIPKAEGTARYQLEQLTEMYKMTEGAEIKNAKLE